MTSEKLHAARRAKNDEFYTQLREIEAEVANIVNISSNPKYYKNPFESKTILCNCDDPLVSNFFYFFSRQFERLKLKKLITTCYRSQNQNAFSLPLFNDAGLEESEDDFSTPSQGLWLEYDGTKNGNSIPSPEEIGVHSLKGDGDFRSSECIELLKQSDIVVTNPPFSLFREFVSQIMTYDKKFLILGNMNAIDYKEIFPLLKENKIWMGASIKSGDREFGVPDHYPLTGVSTRIDKQGRKFVRVKGVRWFTNLDHSKRNEEIPLWKKYTPEDYPKYDNYDAIEVGKVAEIPIDYYEEMGVPITFLDKHNPSQFEIVSRDKDVIGKRFLVNGVYKYARIIIKRKT